MASVDWKQEAQGREKVYFVVVVLLIAVAFGRVAWGPRMHKTRLNQKEFEMVMLRVKTLKARLEEMKKQQQIITVAPVQRPMTTATDDRFAPYLRGEVKSRQQIMGDVVRQITGPQSMKGVALAGLSFGTEADKGTYVAIPLEVDVEGPFTAFVQYLDAIGKIPLMMTIDNIQMTAPPETIGRLQGKIVATVYVVKSAAAITMGGTAPTDQSPPESGKPPMPAGSHP